MNRKAFFKVLGASIVALVSHKLPANLIEQQPAPIDDIVIDWRDNTSGFDIISALEEMVEHAEIVNRGLSFRPYDLTMILAARQIGEDITRDFLAGLRCPVTIEFHGLDCCIQTDSEGAGEI